MSNSNKKGDCFMLKDGITEIIQRYDIDAGVIFKYVDQIMYQHQAEKIFPSFD